MEMKQVLAFVEEKKATFSQLPFYQFLRNEEISPRKRLAFVPCYAFYAMGFGELNAHALREIPTDSQVQALINKHTYEDDDHWIWFLEDLEKLGIDYSIRFSHNLRHLWSRETNFARWTVYQCYRLAYKAHPIQKLAMIEAIEAVSEVLLGATAKVGSDLKRMSEIDCHYFSEHHFFVDTHHQVHSEQDVKFIENLEIPSELQDSVYETVEEVFNIFTTFSDALLEYAQTHEIDQPLKDMAMLDELKYLKPAMAQEVQQTPSTSVSQQSKPLGAYLVESGLLSSDQLTVALNEQQQNPLRLGEIIVRRGWVNQQTVEYVMEKVVLPEREVATIS